MGRGARCRHYCYLSYDLSFVVVIVSAGACCGDRGLCQHPHQSETDACAAGSDRGSKIPPFFAASSFTSPNASGTNSSLAIHLME